VRIGRSAGGAAEAVVEAFAPVMDVPIERVLEGCGQRRQGIDCEELLPLDKRLHRSRDWYRACQYFDMIPPAVSSLLGERRPNSHNQVELHLPLKVEAPARAQRLCEHDGVSHIHPWPTRRKSENCRSRGDVNRSA